MKQTSDVLNLIDRCVKNSSNTERLVEIPFILRELPDPKPNLQTRILDIGATNSSLIIDLDALGFDSWGIDIRDYDYKPDYPKFIKCDARNISIIPDNSFDATVSISVIEHIGLVSTPYYKDGYPDPDGDFKVIREMIRIAKPGGIVLITIPYGSGSSKLKEWIRFYNKDRIQRIQQTFQKLAIEKLKHTIFINGQWMECSEEECAEIHSESSVAGCLCIRGTKKIT